MKRWMDQNTKRNTRKREDRGTNYKHTHGFSKRHFSTCRDQFLKTISNQAVITERTLLIGPLVDGMTLFNDCITIFQTFHLNIYHAEATARRTVLIYMSMYVAMYSFI